MNVDISEVKRTLEECHDDIVNNKDATNDLVVEELLLALGYDKRRNRDIVKRNYGETPIDWEIAMDKGSMGVKVYAVGSSLDKESLDESVETAKNNSFDLLTVTNGEKLDLYSLNDKKVYTYVKTVELTEDLTDVDSKILDAISMYGFSLDEISNILASRNLTIDETIDIFILEKDNFKSWFNDRLKVRKPNCDNIDEQIDQLIGNIAKALSSSEEREEKYKEAEEKYKECIAELRVELNESKDRIAEITKEREELKSQLNKFSGYNVAYAEDIIAYIEETERGNSDKYVAVINDDTILEKELHKFVGAVLQRLYELEGFASMEHLFNNSVFKMKNVDCKHNDLIINNTAYDILIEQEEAEEVIIRLRKIFRGFNDIKFMCKRIGKLNTNHNVDISDSELDNEELLIENDEDTLGEIQEQSVEIDINEPIEEDGIDEVEAADVSEEIESVSEEEASNSDETATTSEEKEEASGSDEELVEPNDETLVEDDELEISEDEVLDTIESLDEDSEIEGFSNIEDDEIILETDDEQCSEDDDTDIVEDTTLETADAETYEEVGEQYEETESPVVEELEAEESIDKQYEEEFKAVVEDNESVEVEDTATEETEEQPVHEDEPSENAEETEEQPVYESVNKEYEETTAEENTELLDEADVEPVDDEYIDEEDCNLIITIIADTSNIFEEYRKDLEFLNIAYLGTNDIAFDINSEFEEVTYDVLLVKAIEAVVATEIYDNIDSNIVLRLRQRRLSDISEFIKEYSAEYAEYPRVFGTRYVVCGLGSIEELAYTLTRICQDLDIDLRDKYLFSTVMTQSQFVLDNFGCDYESIPVREVSGHYTNTESKNTTTALLKGNMFNHVTMTPESLIAHKAIIKDVLCVKTRFTSMLLGANQYDYTDVIKEIMTNAMANNIDLSVVESVKVIGTPYKLVSANPEHVGKGAVELDINDELYYCARIEPWRVANGIIRLYSRLFSDASIAIKVRLDMDAVNFYGSEYETFDAPDTIAITSLAHYVANNRAKEDY